MKKMIAILLAMMLIFAGCGAPKEQEDIPDSGKVTTASGETTKSTEKTTQPATEKTEPTTEATEPVTEPEGVVTVHARIPDNWGTNPHFWAWKLIDNTNAFTAWPGEPMTPNGEWYEIDIPDWCDGVIVNDGGQNQTADLEIEAGTEVWLDVYAYDDVEISYSQPGARRDPGEALANCAGSIVNGVYQNSYFDLSFTLPDAWSFFSNEKLAEKNEMAGAWIDALFSESLSEAIQNGNMVTVMGASNIIGENVGIVVSPEDEMLKGFSDELYYQLTAMAMEQELKSVGMEIDVTVGQTTFRGETVTALCYEFGLCIKQVIIRSEGHNCTITVTALSFETADAIMEHFSYL